MKSLLRTLASVATGISLTMGAITSAEAIMIADIDSAGDTGTITGSPGGAALLFGVDGGIIQGVGNSKVFLTLNQTGGSGPEKGYNTTGAVEFETIASGTTALTLSEVPLVLFGTDQYRVFGFALNQTGGSSDISIEEIQLFQATGSSLTGYNTTTRALPGATEIFDWNGTTTSDYVRVDDFVPGLSNVEMLLLVPGSIFNADPFVYFYTSKGANISANDGPDKWVVADRVCDLIDCEPIPPAQIPEPGILLLLGTGLLGVGLARRHRRT